MRQCSAVEFSLIIHSSAEFFFFFFLFPLWPRVTAYACSVPEYFEHYLYSSKNLFMFDVKQKKSFRHYSLIVIFPQSSRRTSRTTATRPGRRSAAGWILAPRQPAGRRWTYHPRRARERTRRHRRRRRARRPLPRPRARLARRRARAAAAARWPGVCRARRLPELRAAEVAEVRTPPRPAVARCQHRAVARHRNVVCDVAPHRNPRTRLNSWPRCRYAAWICSVTRRSARECTNAPNAPSSTSRRPSRTSTASSGTRSSITRATSARCSLARYAARNSHGPTRWRTIWRPCMIASCPRTASCPSASIFLVGLSGRGEGGVGRRSDRRRFRGTREGSARPRCPGNATAAARATFRRAQVAPEVEKF